ncbi:MAG: hypothetical protein A2430_01060 [Candidatus Liptonbacteria bacterium RIFOXYC1_FULL_36_8]|uniref:DUF192 domain-containing protein n=3 Tax=Candidatus Liptoniibacteriota TaxID=1817909 RepID=A0A1G2CQS0_9BACT|nr:MAG: hypothetical protein A2430_01060 [Candidatus Liptonbacteria bacterium RIFOXYC1_FULL_36_8]OGZ03080.1 MAG: hypothetical protein A2390_02555 [Candidatus Liptonbacteria bacterium RIFOXYB1_FULL_36_10]OGZ03874.1 MAG: hypothetical protein A2604_01155 [Candidatus Liptonbacteria bacterium RIFOXYD1_FULL_36_11]
MRKMIFIVLAVLILILGAAAGFYFREESYEKAEIVFKTEDGEVKFLAEAADTAGKRMKGLSGRESLGEREGMIFIYSKPGRPGFWMKGMEFPIDIVWIKEEKVVGITENMMPESFWKGKIFYPPETADMVLEIKAGEVGKNNIKMGDKVKIVK